VTNPLAPFEDDILAAVADESGVDETALRESLRRHQRTARENPGVDDLVYEWRKYLPYDPLVDRTETAYYCALRVGVWDEYADYLGVDLTAVMAVHDRQARRVAGERQDRYDGAEAMVLTRG
jgi:hypothetical protein